MRKIGCLCLAILLIVLTGCHVVEPANIETTASVSIEDAVNKGAISENNSTAIEYVIYVNSSDGNTGIADTNGIASNVSFGDLSERDFSYADRTEISSLNATPQKEFIMDRSNMKADYVRSFSNSLAGSADEKLHNFGCFDEYRSEESGNRFTVRFRQSDEDMVFFSAKDARNVTGTLTEQNAKSFADAFMAKKYGDQFAAEYPNCDVVVTNNDSNKTITVCYTKYVCGYPTTDRVLVTYNMNGEMKTFNAMTKGLFNSIESSVTNEKIVDAEKVLLDTIPSAWSISTKSLTLDANGSCYLCVTVSRTGNGMGDTGGIVEATEFYINID